MFAQTEKIREILHTWQVFDQTQRRTVQPWVRSLVSKLLSRSFILAPSLFDSKMNDRENPLSLFILFSSVWFFYFVVRRL